MTSGIGQTLAKRWPFLDETRFDKLDILECQVCESLKTIGQIFANVCSKYFYAYASFTVQASVIGRDSSARLDGRLLNSTGSRRKGAQRAPPPGGRGRGTTRTR